MTVNINSNSIPDAAPPAPIGSPGRWRCEQLAKSISQFDIVFGPQYPASIAAAEPLEKRLNIATNGVMFVAYPATDDDPPNTDDVRGPYCVEMIHRALAVWEPAKVEWGKLADWCRGSRSGILSVAGRAYGIDRVLLAIGLDEFEGDEDCISGELLEVGWAIVETRHLREAALVGAKKMHALVMRPSDRPWPFVMVMGLTDTDHIPPLRLEVP